MSVSSVSGSGSALTLASYLSSSSSSSSTTSGTSTGSLASYLSNEDNSTTDMFSALAKRFSTYSLVTGSDGKAIVPSESTLSKLTNPIAKLTVAGEMASFIQVSADAASQTGVATRLEDITTQAQTVMNGVSDAVASLKEKKVDVENCKTQITKVLTSLKTTMTEMSNLTSKASKETAAKVKTMLASMETTGKKVASEAGINWSSLTGGTSAATGTSSTSSARLVNLLT